MHNVNIMQSTASSESFRKLMPEIITSTLLVFMFMSGGGEVYVRKSGSAVNADRCSEGRQ